MDLMTPEHLHASQPDLPSPTPAHQTQEQLRATLRDREELLATVAHDLRNPLGGILLMASAAERQARRLPGGEPVREMAAVLVEMSQHMSGLVDDLLAVAVAKTGRSMLKLQPVTAVGLLARAAMFARPLLAREFLALEVKPEAGLPALTVDADRIVRVFANLLDNALKSTEAGGTITLAAESARGGVKFSVANSGPALEAAELNAMFKPFWQARREHESGAGLGLSICRSIVEAHGGRIWAEPAEGQRVRACFFLPGAPGATALTERRSRS
jgi:signal transduction histidine kinase